MYGPHQRWDFVGKWQLLTRFNDYRADDKSASEYNLEAGATLHLVLALRGGI